MREREREAAPDRRAFLKGLAAVALGGAVAAHARPAAALAGAAPRRMMPGLDRLGVQLYTVRDQMAKDFEGTITRVAQIGYKNLEFAGYNGRTPEQVRALIDRLGVRAPSAHIPLEQLRTALPAQIQAAQTIGHRYITVPSLGRTETPLTTADAWKRVAEEMNRIGAQVKSAGLALAFHSHSGEFLDVGGGRRGMDVFIAETDPSLVSFELDLMWARVASQDPVAWFQRYPGRFKLWHVKDMRNLAAAQAQQAAAFARPPAAPPAPPPAPPPAGAPAAPRPAGGAAAARRRDGTGGLGGDRLGADLRAGRAFGARVLLRRARHGGRVARRLAGESGGQLPLHPAARRVTVARAVWPRVGPRVARRVLAPGLALAGAAACAARPGVRAPAPDAAAARPEWIQLFDGRDLAGWDVKFKGHPLGDNLNDTFRVEHGVLEVRYDRWATFNGEFGHIFYKQPFSYYVVAAEYRFVGEQVTGAGPRNAWAVRNNGVMVHSQSAASMARDQDYPISVEVQLLGGLPDGRPRTTANVCTPGTHVHFGDSLVTRHCTNSTSKTFPGDGWVRVEAVVLGDSLITHVVNGDTVLTYRKPEMGGGSANNTAPGVLVPGQPLAGGYIALQAETAPIDFRKVEVLNLAGCTDPAASNYKRYFVHAEPGACRYAARVRGR